MGVDGGGPRGIGMIRDHMVFRLEGGDDGGPRDPVHDDVDQRWWGAMLGYTIVVVCLNTRLARIVYIQLCGKVETSGVVVCRYLI